MATTVVNSTMTLGTPILLCSIGTGAATGGTAATVTVAGSTGTENGVEVFTITPTKRAGKIAIMFYNAIAFAMTYSIAKSTGYAGVAAQTGTIPAVVGTYAVVVEDALINTGGAYSLTLKPANAKALLTDHIAKVGLLELP